MALVPHASSSGQDEKKGAIVAIRGAQELTQEEYEQRIKDVRTARSGNIMGRLRQVSLPSDAATTAAG